MARERMVTRTVEVQNVTALSLNVETLEASRGVYIIPGKLDAKSLEKAVREAVECVPAVKFVQILSVEVETVLYGMSEADFIAAAKVLPPRYVANDNSGEG